MKHAVTRTNSRLTTFHKEDWMRYPQSVRFENGTDPFIIHGDNYDVVFQPIAYTGYRIDIYFEDCIYSREFKTFSTGQTIMEHCDMHLADEVDENSYEVRLIIDLYDFKKTLDLRG